jgi:hypothetical protein
MATSFSGDILEPLYLLFILVYFNKRSLIRILNILTLALLTVNLAMSTHSTVLQTKNGYGMIICFVP